MSSIIGCSLCRFYRSGSFSCKAFPSGIPIAILSGTVDHDAPIKGDKGIRFTPKKVVKDRSRPQA